MIFFFSNPDVIFQSSSVGLVFRWKFLKRAAAQVDCSPSFQFGELCLLF